MSAIIEIVDGKYYIQE